MFLYTNEMLRKIYTMYCLKNNIKAIDGARINNIVNFYNFAKEIDERLDCPCDEFYNNLKFAFGGIAGRFPYYENPKTMNYTIHRIINLKIYELEKNETYDKEFLCKFIKETIDRYVLVDNAEKEIIYKDIIDKLR